MGELAKCYFPGGIEITSLNQSEAVSETRKLLQQDNIILFEPAIEFENCLVRVDILIKTSCRVELHEVKAKSFDSQEGAEFLKRYYFDPRTRGSNSIKYVLPAILGCSGYLQAKYSQPIYGSHTGIQSLNFKNWQWLKFDDTSAPINPYDQLPKLFSDREDRQIELLSDNDSLQNGGAALMAYARMQFERMSDYVYQELSQALLKYCELDTLAMVMIYEAWYHELYDGV